MPWWKMSASKGYELCETIACFLELDGASLQELLVVLVVSSGFLECVTFDLSDSASENSINVASWLWFVSELTFFYWVQQRGKRVRTHARVTLRCSGRSFRSFLTMSGASRRLELSGSLRKVACLPWDEKARKGRRLVPSLRGQLCCFLRTRQ